jgi:hypothetical protein
MNIEIVAEYLLTLILGCFTLCFIAFTAFFTSMVAQFLAAGFADWKKARKSAIEKRDE